MIHKGKNVCVLIPAYNEEQSVGLVVRQVLVHKTITKCVVVDDGSTDNTSIVAKKAGAYVIRKKQNGGSGKAIITGLEYLSGLNPHCVILMDADGQHDPNDMTRLVHEIDNGADYVIASRYILPSANVTSRIRKIGTQCISLWIFFWFGKRIFDPTSGYRACNLKTLRYLLDHYPTHFSEPEIILDLLEKKFVIKEIPCQMKPRLFGQSSISMQKAITLMMYIVFETMRRHINHQK